jgi:uncharacterized DUF497 family protein
MTKVSYDPAKDLSNQVKHGLSLALALSGTRSNASQTCAATMVKRASLYCVVFVDRPNDAPTERRIISLRKANSREVNSYDENS